MDDLMLTVGRWLVDADEEADLTFAWHPNLQMGEIALQWGAGPRQSRTYALQVDDLAKIDEWLSQLRTDAAGQRSHRAPGS